jgi:gamma-glutamyltranspeptidase
MALGSPGGSTIPSTVVAGLLYALAFQLAPQETVDAPRLLARRVTEHVDQDAEWFCQAQGALVTYFQVREAHRPFT